MESASRRVRPVRWLLFVVLLAVCVRFYVAVYEPSATAFDGQAPRNIQDAVRLFVAGMLSVVAAALATVAGRRWLNTPCGVLLGGVAGALVLGGYNSVWGALLGLSVGVLVICGLFGRAVRAMLWTVGTMLLGLLLGLAVLATDEDLSDGPNVVAALALVLCIVSAAIVLGRSVVHGNAVRVGRWLWLISSRLTLLTLLVGCCWLTFSLDTVRRAAALRDPAGAMAYAGHGNATVTLRFQPFGARWLWQGPFGVERLCTKPGITDEDMAALAAMPELRELTMWGPFLRGTKISDSALVHLKGLTKLQILDLGGTPITDAGLEHLEGLTNLRVLDLRTAPVTDAGLKHLQALRGLRSLNLWGTRIQGQGFKALQGKLILNHVGLGNTPLTDDGLQALGTLRTLNYLDLSGTRITDAGVKHLQGLKWLKRLGLAGTEISDAGLAHLKGMSILAELSLGKTQITDAGLASLLRLPALHSVGLSDTRITDAGLAQLAQINTLTTLDLGKTHVTDAGVEHLQGMKQLMFLDLTDTDITPAGLERLQNSLPSNCRIEGPGSQTTTAPESTK